MPIGLTSEASDILTFKEVCTMLGIQPRTGARWIAKKEFPEPFLAKKRKHVTRRWRRDDVLQWCKDNKVKAKRIRRSNRETL